VANAIIGAQKNESAPNNKEKRQTGGTRSHQLERPRTWRDAIESRARDRAAMVRLIIGKFSKTTAFQQQKRWHNFGGSGKAVHLKRGKSLKPVGKLGKGKVAREKGTGRETGKTKPELSGRKTHELAVVTGRNKTSQRNAPRTLIPFRG